MADLNAGDRIVASGLKHPFQVAAAASANLTMTTTTVTDITGATVTFNTVQAAATVLVWGVFDTSVTSSGASLATGSCYVDGVAQTPAAIAQLQTVGTRYTIGQVWTATLSGSGSHTIKLRGNLNTAAGTAIFNQTHTTITVQVNDF
jgi:hypothetical protein